MLGMTVPAAMKRSRRSSEVDALIGQYAPMVRHIATRMVSRLPANIELDDLIASGMMGLLECARRYVETPPTVQFSTYATARVQGAMLDDLRRQDWMPRTVRERARKTQAAIHATEQRLGRAPTEAEVADTLGVSTEQYRRTLSDVAGIQILHSEDLRRDEDDLRGGPVEGVDQEADPARSLVRKRLREALARAVEKLPERERLVLSLTYEQDMSNIEIAQVLGVGSARVSQLRTQAVLRLRAATATSSGKSALADYKDAL